MSHRTPSSGCGCLFSLADCFFRPSVLYSFQVGAKPKAEVDELMRRLHVAEKGAAETAANTADLLYKAEARRRGVSCRDYLPGCLLFESGASLLTSGKTAGLRPEES
jgi:hypothetical protein